ncbi:hypothetical protein [Streptomyces anulatus]|uniref:hypothetical protein n=1 Tax=Streptomyces anulatus TaxID=1892 RepID=UPI00324F2E4A|nr:hypothetical protein OH791_37440 [Streptomyces anulatus]
MDRESLVALVMPFAGRCLDPHSLAARATSPKVIDGRGTLNADTWREAGWTFRALGRP